MLKLCKTKLNKSQHCSLIVRRLLVLRLIVRRLLVLRLIVRRLLVLLVLGGIADHHQTLQQLHQKFVLKIIMSFQAECW